MVSGRATDDLHFPKSFSCPISEKETLIKAEQIAKKQEGISTSFSQLVVKLLREYVERNESLESPINPLNIQYRSKSNNNDITAIDTHVETLDELLASFDNLYDYMTDDRRCQNINYITRIEQSAIQLQQFAKRLYYDRRGKESNLRTTAIQ
jgi:phage FluMu protein gp41